MCVLCQMDYSSFSASGVICVISVFLTLIVAMLVHIFAQNAISTTAHSMLSHHASIRSIAHLFLFVYRNMKNKKFWPTTAKQHLLYEQLYFHLNYAPVSCFTIRQWHCCKTTKWFAFISHRHRTGHHIIHDLHEFYIMQHFKQCKQNLPPSMPFYWCGVSEITEKIFNFPSQTANHPTALVMHTAAHSSALTSVQISAHG